MYRFTAGPDSEPYTVRTPYTAAAVRHAMRETGMSQDVMHGALLMLMQAPEGLLDAVIVGTNGSGLNVSLRALHTQLAG